MIYNEGDRVKFDNSVVSGTGVIRGVATEGGPIIGRGYIVEVLSATPAIPTSIYPYSCMQVFEVHLKKDE